MSAFWWVAAALGIGVGAVLVLEKDEPKGPAPIPPPEAKPPVPGNQEQPIQIALSGPIELFPGHTYFAVVELNGLASAGSASSVKSEAEKLGFRDVAVFTDRDRPQFWPGTQRGGYYVRGTYRGTQKTQPAKTSGFLWSVVVRDAWIAPLSGGEL